MIILVTGQPGSGKTAHVVDMLANDAQFQNRTLICGGIPDLLLPHEVVPPVAEWTELRKAPEDETLELAYFTFPQNAVIVVDEAQRIYRPRALSSKVPPEVAAFETHRHTGVDFILITQHPGLLDPNIKKLVGKHIHIAVTPFGRYRYEWTKCVDPESKTERDIAARSKYTLPKRAFSLYKSSELHTKIKVRMPGYVYLLGIALIACLVWRGTSMAEFRRSPVRRKLPRCKTEGRQLAVPLASRTRRPLNTFPLSSLACPVSFTPRLDTIRSPCRTMRLGRLCV